MLLKVECLFLMINTHKYSGNIGKNFINQWIKMQNYLLFAAHTVNLINRKSDFYHFLKVILQEL